MGTKEKKRRLIYIYFSTQFFFYLNFQIVSESKPTEEELKGINNSGSIVDDKFFKLNELDKYLEAEDRKEMKRNKGGEDSDEDDEELIDYFEDDESEEEDEDVSLYRGGKK